MQNWVPGQVGVPYGVPIPQQMSRMSNQGVGRGARGGGGSRKHMALPELDGNPAAQYTLLYRKIFCLDGDPVQRRIVPHQEETFRALEAEIKASVSGLKRFTDARIPMIFQKQPQKTQFFFVDEGGTRVNTLTSDPLPPDSFLIGSFVAARDSDSSSVQTSLCVNGEPLAGFGYGEEEGEWFRLACSDGKPVNMKITMDVMGIAGTMAWLVVHEVCGKDLLKFFRELCEKTQRYVPPLGLPQSMTTVTERCVVLVCKPLDVNGLVYAIRERGEMFCVGCKTRCMFAKLTFPWLQQREVRRAVDRADNPGTLYKQKIREYLCGRTGRILQEKSWKVLLNQSVVAPDDVGDEALDYANTDEYHAAIHDMLD